VRLTVINPNTTQTMTEVIGAAARAAASPGTEIVAVQPQSGPTSIEGVYDGALAVPGVIEEILRAEAAVADGHIIACFDDTGLDAARSAAHKPVIGIGEAAFHVASLVAHRFTVITTLPRSVPIIERNLAVTGLAGRCVRVRASDIPVLTLDNPKSDAQNRIAAIIATAIRDDAVDGIVLGCAGMAHLAEALSAAHGLPVIEGVSAAVRLAEAVVALGLTTSKRGLWASPLPKRYTGVFASFAPDDNV
jgi:allantoin racemase